MDITTSTDSIRLHTTHTSPRQRSSNLDFADTLRYAASKGLNQLGRAADVASPYLPGAPVVSAALKNSAQNLALDSMGGMPMASTYPLAADGVSPDVSPSVVADPNLSTGGNVGFANTVQGMDAMLRNMRTEGEQMLVRQQQFHDTSFRLATASAALKVDQESRMQITRNLAST